MSAVYVENIIAGKRELGVRWLVPWAPTTLSKQKSECI